MNAFGCRSSRATIVAGLALALSLFPAATARDSSEPIFTRTEVLEGVAGEARLRAGYSKRFEMPQVDCDGERFSCTEDLTYRQAYSIAFSRRTVTKHEDRTHEASVEDRGTLFVAIDLDVEPEESLELVLRGALSRLSASSYAYRLADLGWMRAPFSSIDFLPESQHSPWVCELRDDSCRCDMMSKETETIGMTTGHSSPFDGSVCEQIEGALAGSAAEEFPTTPLAMRELRTEVRVEVSTGIRGDLLPEQIFVLPDELTFTKAALPEGRLTGGIRDRKQGDFVGHEGRYHGVERDVRLPPLSLDLIETPMTVLRWQVTRRQVLSGAEPKTSMVGRDVMYVALIPIPDPLDHAATIASDAVSEQVEELIANAREYLPAADEIGLGRLRTSLWETDIWDERHDWLLVTCWDDEAKYGIAPFATGAPLTNVREACAELRGYFADDLDEQETL